MENFTTFPTLEALQKPHPLLRALLFDMDGTLLRTEEIHGEVLRQMAKGWGLIPPYPAADIEAHLKGMSDQQVYQLATAWEGFPRDLSVKEFIAQKNILLLELIPKIPLKEWCSPALIALIQSAKKNDILTAVVTSSERSITDLLLRLSGIDQWLDLTITLQDVRYAKPHPWPYLQAMTRLGVGPRETIIFEDSPPGITAGLASGARVVAVDWWRE